MSSSEGLATRLAEAEDRLATQQIQIEQLQTQILLYQRVIDTLPINIFWKDRDLAFRGCNMGLAHIAGVDKTADLIGKTDHDMPWAGDQAEVYLADDRDVIANDRPKLNIIHQVSHSDGTTAWIETKKLPFHDLSGEVIGLVAMVEDITDRKVEEERQAASREAVITQQKEMLEDRKRMMDKLTANTHELQLYHAIIEQSPNGVIIANNHGKIAYTNTSFKAMSGLDVDENTSLAMLFPAALHERIQAEVSRAIQEQGYWHGRIPLTRPDNTNWVAQVSLFMLSDPISNTPRWIAFFRDITADEQAADALRANEALLRSLTEALPVVLAVVNTQGIFRVSTGKGLAALGLKSGQLVGVPIFEAFSNAADIVSDIHRGLSGETFTMQRRVRNLIFENTYTPLHSKQGEIEGLILISSDITERLKAEQESLELREQVIAAQRAALRELSTPLIPVTSDVVVMPLIGSIDSARAQQVIEDLLDGVQRMQAKTAILDITGVPVVDTQIANVLLRAAQAVRLLGAQVILTGIRPEVAQTLIGLGADLSGIITRGTLQAAITQALHLSEN